MKLLFFKIVVKNVVLLKNQQLNKNKKEVI